MNAKDAHKILRTEKFAVVPEILPFCDSHFVFVGKYFDVVGETSKAHKIRSTCSNAVIFFFSMQLDTSKFNIITSEKGYEPS